MILSMRSLHNCSKTRDQPTFDVLLGPKLRYLAISGRAAAPASRAHAEWSCAWQSLRLPLRQVSGKSLEGNFSTGTGALCVPEHRLRSVFRNGMIAALSNTSWTLRAVTIPECRVISKDFLEVGSRQSKDGLVGW